MAAAFRISDSDMAGFRPPLPASCSGSLKSCLRPFTNQVVLEFRQSAEYMKNESTTGAGGIYSFCQRFETNLSLIQVLDNLNKVFE